MGNFKKSNPIEAAKQLINKQFQNCQGALLAGSVVRGEATETSDLDIVVFDKNLSSSYRESLIDFGWNIEVFVHNLISYKHFFKNDYALDDFIGCTNRAEEIFIANTLAELVSEFVLRTNRKWIGVSKWVVRSLRHYDGEFADYFVEAFDTYYKTGDKYKIIQLVDNILQPYGGRLFDGFSLGKE
jgi:hypothetical protein